MNDFPLKIRAVLGKIKRRILRAFDTSQNIPRFQPGEVNFRGKKLYFHDIASYRLGLRELFNDKAYNFKSRNASPLIIDCGANLGMSIIYFKELYPAAKIIAFEADDYIFSFLQKNMGSFGCSDVELVNKAVWDCETELSFWPEGGAGGRVEVNAQSDHAYKKVSAVRLKPYLQGNRVDFLKIDIEGAEYEVLKDCADSLVNVERIFIEYHSMLSKEQTLHEVLEIIHSAGFRYQIKGVFASRHPYVTINTNVGMDLQLSIYAYRDAISN
jgi:FkbM family methyltransferase